jgi:hypothetical protein
LTNPVTALSARYALENPPTKTRRKNPLKHFGTTKDDVQKYANTLRRFENFFCARLNSKKLKGDQRKNPKSLAILKAFGLTAPFSLKPKFR